MTRSTLRRLEVLERQAPKDTDKWHSFLGGSDRDEERESAALKVSLKWAEGDNLMVIR